MRIRRLIAVALLAGGLGGCTGFEENMKKIPWGWPFVRKAPDVPVTEPAGSGDKGYAEGWLLPSDEEIREGPTIAPTTKPTSPAAKPPPEVRPPLPDVTKVAVPPKGAVPGEVRVVTASALQVNQTYISIDDVLRRARKKLRELPEGISEDTFRHKAAEGIGTTLRDMITEALVMQEAEKNLTDPLRKQIEADLNEARQKMVNEFGGGSQKKLEHALIKDGTDLKTVMAEERRGLTVQVYLRSRFMPSITVNRQTLLDYFQRHRDQFASDKKVQMQVIFAPTRSFLAKVEGQPSQQELQAARGQAKALIDQAARALMSGEDFGEVAKRLSRGPKAREGGLWELMPAGSFRHKEVEKTAFAMEEARVSLPIETQAGFFIVKVTKIKPGKVARFEDAQEEITAILRQEQYIKLTEDYFQKLLARSTIGDSARLLERAVDQAVARYWKGPPIPRTR